MKKLIAIISFCAIVITLVSVVSQNQRVEAAGSSNTHPTFYIASSTVYSVTTTSVRLLGTSTPTQRVGASVQPINCTTGSTGGAYLNANRDVIAAVTTGPFAFASSTLLFGDYMNQLPVTQGPVQAVVPSGTCTIIVTEWRLIQ